MPNIYYSTDRKTEAVVNPLDASSAIGATGLLGIFAVLVAETGLLPGFFLPGDSLLFTAGLLAASSGVLHLPLGGVHVVAAGRRKLHTLHRRLPVRAFLGEALSHEDAEPVRHRLPRIVASAFVMLAVR